MTYQLFQADYIEICRSTPKCDFRELERKPFYPTLDDYFRREAKKYGKGKNYIEVKN